MTYEDDRIGRLEAATERLSQNVVGLSTSLAIISEITKRQSDLEVRAAKTEASASKIETVATQTQQDLITVREINRRTWISVLFSVVILSFLVGYVRYESVKQINERLKVSEQFCNVSNARSEIESGILVYSARNAKGPDRAALVAAVDKIRGLEANCVVLFGPKNSPHFFQR